MDSRVVMCGGSLVVLARDPREPDGAFARRAWAVARAVESGAAEGVALAEVVGLSRCLVASQTLGVRYPARVEAAVQKMFLPRAPRVECAAKTC